MAFSFLRNVQNSGSGTTLSCTIVAPKVGELVVVDIKFSGTVTGLTITDNVGNTYALAAGPILNTTEAYQFYAVQEIPGATSVTGNWTTSRAVRMTVNKFNGGMKTNVEVFDVAASATGTGASAAVALTPSVADELIVVGVSFNAAVSSPVAGANYRMSNAGTGQATQYRQVGTASETAPMTWTNSVAWVEIAGAYKPYPTTGNFMRFIA